MKEFIMNNVEYIATVIVLPAITWFFSKRHFQDRELNNKDIELVRQNIKLYQSILDDMEGRYEAHIAKLYLEIKNLEDEIERLKKLITNESE